VYTHIVIEGKIQGTERRGRAHKQLENTGTWKRKQCIALFGERTLEKGVDLSQDKVMNAHLVFFIKAGSVKKTQIRSEILPQF